MSELPEIGVVSRPEGFRYAGVMEEGKQVHEGDRFSARHPKMDYGRRAKIFAPFAALKGFEEEVQAKRVRYETEREKDEDALRELNEQLQRLQKLTERRRSSGMDAVQASAEYFVPCEDAHHEDYHCKGRYVTAAGPVRRVDVPGQMLWIGMEKIPFARIYSLQIKEPQVQQ